MIVISIPYLAAIARALFTHQVRGASRDAPYNLNFVEDMKLNQSNTMTIIKRVFLIDSF